VLRAHSASAISESIWPLGKVWMRPDAIAFWTVLAETPRCREYARWLITGMFLFPK
jgi:hypothetical protein